MDAQRHLAGPQVRGAGDCRYPGAVALDIPRGVDVLVNAVCPGWARTRMGGAGATVPVEDAAEGIVWAATLPPGSSKDELHGRFFRDRRPIPW